uniref:Reverse transcriptase domain-containing protein n=1 Tax=Clastoptera arizonana TaxID=38151 RepID=A0A1B6EE57_9HEMI
MSGTSSWLHRRQPAYTACLSMETALHLVVSYIKKLLEARETVIGAFVDIKGAFNTTTRESIEYGWGPIEDGLQNKQGHRGMVSLDSDAGMMHLTDWGNITVFQAETAAIELFWYLGTSGGGRHIV